MILWTGDEQLEDPPLDVDAGAAQSVVSAIRRLTARGSRR